MTYIKLFLFGLILESVMMSCSEEKGPLVLSRHAVTLKVGDDLKLEATGVPGAEWSTDNDFVADMLVGWVTARHVGTTKVRAVYKGFTDECMITVTPKSTLLVDPILAFGASSEYIRTQEPGTFKKRCPMSSIDPSKTNLFYDVYDRGGVILEYYFDDNMLEDINQTTTKRLSFAEAILAAQERFIYISADKYKWTYFQPVLNYYMLLYPPSDNPNAAYSWDFWYVKTVDL